MRTVEIVQVLIAIAMGLALVLIALGLFALHISHRENSKLFRFAAYPLILSGILLTAQTGFYILPNLLDRPYKTGQRIEGSGTETATFEGRRGGRQLFKDFHKPKASKKGRRKK